MANNRMWLVNTATGQRLLLAKHMVGAWYVPAVNEDIEAKLNALFNAEVKQFCAPWGSTAWRLEFEKNEPEWDAQLKANQDDPETG